MSIPEATTPSHVKPLLSTQDSAQKAADTTQEAIKSLAEVMQETMDAEGKTADAAASLRQRVDVPKKEEEAEELTSSDEESEVTPTKNASSHFSCCCRIATIAALYGITVGLVKVASNYLPTSDQ